MQRRGRPGVRREKGPRTQPRHLRNQLHHHDPAFVDRLLWLFAPLERYFRYEVRGIEHVPADRGCLLVLNHGVVPFHGFFLFRHLAVERGIYARGLGAGFIFDLPLVRTLFLKGGAVNANPRNAAELIGQGHVVMLAPGGIYEALVTRPGMTRIPWERRLGFARMAVETGCPVVPSYCPAINDVYLNSRLLLRHRIALLEKTRFSVPLPFGIGVLPFPKRLVHHVGAPLAPEPPTAGSRAERIRRLHERVVAAMTAMADGGRTPQSSTPGGAA